MEPSSPPLSPEKSDSESSTGAFSPSDSDYDKKKY